jgi:hypothetical protein
MHLVQSYEWMEDKLWIIPAKVLTATDGDIVPTEVEASSDVSAMITSEPAEPSEFS